MSVEAQILDIEQQFQRLQGRKEAVDRSIVQTTWEIDRQQKRKISRCELAQKFLQQIAQKTQKELEYSITELVKLCLDAVMGEDAPNFKLEFVQKRGKTEVEIYFEEKGKLLDPLSEDGGGAVDIAAFGLRISLWTLLSKQRKVMILDEPFKCLSVDYQPKAFEMIKKISEKLGMQFIIVSAHGADMTESADKVFEVRRVDRVSKVKEIGE